MYLKSKQFICIDCVFGVSYWKEAAGKVETLGSFFVAFKVE